MLTIDFLTDYVCPFCLVTKENLRAALKTLHQEAEIIEHPYALTPEGGEGWTVPVARLELPPPEAASALSFSAISSTSSAT